MAPPAYVPALRRSIMAQRRLSTMTALRRCLDNVRVAAEPTSRRHSCIACTTRGFHASSCCGADASTVPCQVRQQVAAKSEARAGLLQDYVSATFSEEDVGRVLDSIADANNYITFNVAPVER